MTHRGLPDYSTQSVIPSLRHRHRWFALFVISLMLTLVRGVNAGGGPMEVMVLYGAQDDRARAVADHYLEARHIPPSHLCAIQGLEPETRTITFETYQEVIAPALEGCFAALSYPEEINYIILVRGLPYRVSLGENGFYTSLSAMIQVHPALYTDDTSLAGLPQAQNGNFFASIENPLFVAGDFESGDFQVENPYSAAYQASTGVVRSDALPLAFARWELRTSQQIQWKNSLFIVHRLDGFDYDDAHALIDRAIEAEATIPQGRLICMAGADSARSARDPECEFATRHLEMAGLNGMWLDTHDAQLSGMELGALFTGTQNLVDGIDGNTFHPGALVDNLTSFGAVPDNFFCDEDTAECPASESQTSIARFVRAGATGVHGAAAEPLNNSFPNASALLFYTFGYSAGESWLFSQPYLYWQDIYLGDPLVSPYAERPQVTISWSTDDEHEVGQPVSITAAHSAGIALLRLFADGELVKETAGTELSWQPGGGEGESLRLLAIAVAHNAPVERPGWPASSQTPLTNTQGWSSRETILVAPQDDSDGNEDDALTEDAGCGCSATSGHEPTGVWLWIAVCFLFRSHRRAPTIHHKRVS